MVLDVWAYTHRVTIRRLLHFEQHTITRNTISQHNNRKGPALSTLGSQTLHKKKRQSANLRSSYVKTKRTVNIYIYTLIYMCIYIYIYMCVYIYTHKQQTRRYGRKSSQIRTHLHKTVKIKEKIHHNTYHLIETSMYGAK